MKHHIRLRDYTSGEFITDVFSTAVPRQKDRIAVNGELRRVHEVTYEMADETRSFSAIIVDLLPSMGEYKKAS